MSGIDSSSDYMSNMDVLNDIFATGKVHDKIIDQEKQKEEYLRQPETKYRMPIEHMLDELYLNRETVTGEEILSTLSEYAQYYDAVSKAETIYSDVRHLKVVKKKIHAFKSVYKSNKKEKSELEKIIESFKNKHSLPIKDIEGSVEHLIRKDFLGEHVEGNYVGNMRKIAIGKVAKYLDQTLKYLNDPFSGFKKSEKYTRQEAEEVFNNSLQKFNPQEKEEELRREMIEKLHRLRKHIHSPDEFIEYVESFNKEIDDMEKKVADSL